MALNASILAAALQDAALNQPVAASTDSAASATYIAMAQAIIDHIKNYASVSVTVPGPTLAAGWTAGAYPVIPGDDLTGTGTIT